jgi:AcrR family transcriptional regulator
VRVVDARSPTPSKKPRADAQRNRTRLLEVAKRTFAEKGSTAGLEEIARAAGVGIGTLYRHFPTRDALIEAVYRNETRELAESARRLAADRPPVEALRAWMLLFVDHMATKQGMAEALNSIVGGPQAIYADAGVEVRQAIEALVAAAVAAGELAVTVSPLDLLRALAGLAYMSPEPTWRTSAEHLVDILIAGSRTTR